MSEIKKSVKFIVMGNRQCILTEEHCIPCDMVARIQFDLREVDYQDTAHAKIYTASEKDGLRIGHDEAKQLKKMLGMLVAP